MTAPGTFDAAPCDGVVRGTCVMLIDDKIVYAGPIKAAPSSDGKVVLLNVEDYQRLRGHVERGRH